MYSKQQSRPLSFVELSNESKDEMAKHGSELIDLEIDSSVKTPLCHFFRVFTPGDINKPG